MRGSAKEFRLDPDRIALWGNSAGAHLAAMVALAGDSPLFKNAYPQDKFASRQHQGEGADRHLRHLRSDGAVEALADPESGRQPGGVAARRLADAEPPLYFDASPISYATVDNNKTAVFVIWGTEDDVVDYKTQSLEFLTRSSRRNSRRGPAWCTARRTTG